MEEQRVEATGEATDVKMRAVLAGALLSTVIMGAGCADAESSPVEPTTENASIAQPLDQPPVTSSSNDAGQIVLSCHTGADVGPLTVDVGVDVSAWMEACTSELGESGSGDFSAEQVEQCAHQVVRETLGKDRRDGTLVGDDAVIKASPTSPFVMYNAEGRWWLYCQTGASVGENPLPLPADGVDQWKEDCRAGASGGGGDIDASPVGVERLRERVAGGGSNNPVCAGVEIESAKPIAKGFGYWCEPTDEMLSSARADRATFQGFVDACPGKQVKERAFATGVEENQDVIYVCSADGVTMPHAAGVAEFVEFEAECLVQQGRVYSRALGEVMPDEGVGYFCTATGLVTESVTSVRAYKRAQSSCWAKGGSLLSNLPNQAPTSEPIGRDGRGDNIEKGNPVIGRLSTGEKILICMPDGDYIIYENYQEFQRFDYECKQRGGTVVVWSIFESSDERVETP